jgi:hypothetical protein
MGRNQEGSPGEMGYENNENGDSPTSQVLHNERNRLLDGVNESHAISLNRLELGLKQAFQMADVDKSGSVSSAEVILKFSMFLKILNSHRPFL